MASIDNYIKKEAAEREIHIRPKLVNRSRCYTYQPEDGCLYCGTRTFRYYCSACGKNYYQCEKCRGINH